ncbi:Prealbumin-like fold domain-containing protein OS=Streptomyces aurantiogriseus OX=66870 GN=GCM10010251_59860 PE=4 SV=1 [Streptomyces aurantiogriseus]
MALYAREFFMEHLKLPFADAAVVGNTYYATPTPGGPLRLRIDFARTIRADEYTNAKTATTPKPTSTEKPTDKPTDTPSTPTDKPTESASGGSKTNPTATDSSIVPSSDGTDSASPKTPAGSLAHTGADATPWILGGAGLLLVGGIGAVVAARRHKDSEPDQDENAETN